MSSHSRIDEVLDLLRKEIQSAVRAEQHRDQLTLLPNDAALTEWIAARLVEEQPAWLAFIEIDRFKEVNDRFGYENADELLKEVAKILRSASGFFSETLAAFRAHGDEFYLGGYGAENSNPESALDVVRQCIGALRITAKGNSSPMTCTVSIGWTTFSNARTLSSSTLTQRGLKQMLEAAVSYAKIQGRNRVCMYSEVAERSQSTTLRRDCPTCKAKFSVDISADSSAYEYLYCPNCGDRQARPQPRPVQALVNHKV